MTEDNTMAAAAARLFEYLRDVQRLRVKPVVTVAEYATSGGMVVDLDSVPTGFGVDASGLHAPDGSAAVLVIPRIASSTAPPPPEDVKPWLEGGWTTPGQVPTLVNSLTFPTTNSSGTGPLEVREETIEDHPEIDASFDAWLSDWTEWAEHERATKPTRDLYQRVYVARETVAAASQDWELVLGVGRLRWQPADRHVLVQPVRIELDETSGALRVMREDVFSVEQDMLTPEQLPGADATAALTADLGMPFELESMGERLTTFTNRLSSTAAFGPNAPGDPGAPWLRFAPSLILRRRSRLGLVQVLDDIAAYLRAHDEVPEGLLPLVDPDSAPDRRDHMDPSTEGAVLWHENEYFLPLPVNAEQFEVIRRVDHQPLTLVQGPPGTGKTHTTAALISHLLAQGKRVLVTAQTEQALREVRDKLPAEIQDLAVAVLGTGQAERALLTKSVSILAERAHQHSQAGVEHRVDRFKADLTEAAARRATSRNRLVEIREADVAENRVGDFHGTRARIAEQISELSSQFEWTLDVLDDSIAERGPLPSSAWVDLLSLLREAAFAEKEVELSQAIPDLMELPSSTTFAGNVQALHAAEQVVGRLEAVSGHPALRHLRDCAPATFSELDAELHDMRSAMTAWTGRDEPWIADCFASITTGRTSTWVTRQSSLRTRIDTANVLASQMGDEHSIVVDPRLDGRGTVMAQALLEHLGTGGEIKADALGNPKLGMLTPKTVKACAPLFQATRVDGRPPVSAATLNRLVARIELADCLDALDVAWPATVVPPEDTLGERLAWHTTELQVLDKLMAFAERIDRMSERLGTLGVGELDWASTSDVDSIRDCLALVNAERQQVAQAEPLRDLERALEAVDMPTHPSPIARALASAVRQRDTSLYTGALDEAAQLKALLDRRDRRDSLLAEVTNVSASMASQLSEESPDDVWTARLSVMDQAWAWRYAVAWLTRTRTENVNQLQVAIRAEEDRMRVAVARIAAHLAWAKSVGRLKQSQISDLVQYTQLVKKLGKGTGKYAARQQDEIRKVLARCTDSVPVWIVPLHRVATQFRVEPELFDVVIVDEASQAGLDATFLQFLGRKIVVVGDDKQVSPTVIIDHSSVHQLAAHYLADSPYAATWSDPERSLFDEARAKYHDLVTLVEHRRCVPDIIGFSNEIAYEPEGIRLIPVRETGSSALDPVIPVFVDNGFVEGTTSARRNRPEARALVDSIKACIADDRYSGMTMGVISLLGEAQARLIESLLLDELGPVEIAKRELRCGVAAAFQGAERDVMFLSMVAATDDDNRFAAQTKETATQRYNVAVSRAKDQVWVFHSEPLANLANPQDLRRRLLEYAGRVNMRRGSGVPGATQGLAPDDVLITPFGSVFEQRVHNRIFERGYIVVPQYESLGYRIDLVVVGERGKFAIECDGDHWHGPERYLADLARQRDLERCGWRFFRLRESDFNVDRHRSLEALWPMLQALDTPAATFPAHLGTPSAALAANPQAPDPGLSGHGTLNDPKPPVPALKQTGSSESALTDPEIASQERPDPAAFLPGALVSESADTGSGNPISLRGQPRRAGLLFLAPYAEWTSATILPEALQARPDQLAESLLDIVQTEGPILGDRVMHLYLRASGGLRLGKALAARLASALERLERDGQVLIDNPTRTYNRGQQTYRTPNQPLVHMRERGPRTLYEIPQLELRELMGRLEDQQGLSDQALWRATVNSYGLTRLEEKTVSHLRRIATFPQPHPEDVN